ncbi:MAG: tRNA preQ1(34) S-adenosylmethionine ribosyltransferase-isomerase QueA [Sporomusaceae bacterium]|jgi:S-adenosylmethionine:tRNA ribosyltransferase-isomerase|nr:tRNA preQ1(34) S-adenosylmethionine ribosyltransferase-isomerase QueA [Sporomusaceae bacterium]
MLTKDFDYHLPPEAIAQKPLEPRDTSRLLVMGRETEAIEHTVFSNLPQYLNEGDTLIFNNTKVMPARLLGTRAATGGKVEVFLLNRLQGDEWEVLVKPGKKARPGARIVFAAKGGAAVLEGEVLDVTPDGGRVVRFFYDGSFEEIIELVGETPLPPYIKEKLTDKNRYQTIYASEQGSAAAPTAGLHFTKELMEKIKAKGVNTAFVTLHVGLGTFRPVKAEKISEHTMHQEYYSIPEETIKIIEATKKKGGRIIAVGTTAVRTLETYGQRRNGQAKSGWTDIFLYPGSQFSLVDGMITNFHLPKSTLLMLVCAFAGQQKTLAAYEEAVKSGYRFFSFGDAMLIV